MLFDNMKLSFLCISSGIYRSLKLHMQPKTVKHLKKKLERKGKKGTKIFFSAHQMHVKHVSVAVMVIL